MCLVLYMFRECYICYLLLYSCSKKNLFHAKKYENTLSFVLLLLSFIGDVYSSIFLFVFIAILMSTFVIHSYRRYSKDIPQFLRNRPQDFVKHYLLNTSLAENIDLSGIINTGGGDFTVVSFQVILKQRYEFCFGDTYSMSRCSCND